MAVAVMMVGCCLLTLSSAVTPRKLCHEHYNLIHVQIEHLCLWVLLQESNSCHFNFLKI